MRLMPRNIKQNGQCLFRLNWIEKSSSLDSRFSFVSHSSLQSQLYPHFSVANHVAQHLSEAIDRLDSDEVTRKRTFDRDRRFKPFADDEHFYFGDQIAKIRRGSLRKCQFDRANHSYGFMLCLTVERWFTEDLPSNEPMKIMAWTTKRVTIS